MRGIPSHEQGAEQRAQRRARTFRKQLRNAFEIVTVSLHVLDKAALPDSMKRSHDK